MNYKYTGCDLTEQDKQDIFDILCECDDEFYPKLSSRNSTSQQELKKQPDSEGDKPYTYFEDMIKQEFIVVYDNERIIAFMTFKKNYVCEATREIGPSIYVSTVCVRKSYRHQGILHQLYDELEKVTGELKYNFIFTRTWSLNQAQIHSLLKHGYQKIKVNKDERGEGIDTVYFGKRI